MAPTILIKICWLIVNSKPNNMAQMAFPEEIPETGKIFFLSFMSVSYRSTLTNWSILLKFNI